MNKGIWKIGNICFDSEEEYIAAQNDIKKIKIIMDKSDIKNPKIAKKLYGLLKNDNNIFKSKTIKEMFLEKLIDIFVKDCVDKQDKIIINMNFDEAINFLEEPESIAQQNGKKVNSKIKITKDVSHNEKIKSKKDVLIKIVFLFNTITLLLTGLYYFESPIIKSNLFWRIIGNLWFIDVRSITFFNFVILVIYIFKFIIKILKQVIYRNTMDFSYIKWDIAKVLLIILLLFSVHKIYTGCEERTMFSYLYTVINSGDPYLRIYKYMREIIFGIG